MPHRKHIAELDLKIENILQAIEALRIRKASPPELNRALSELARVKAERLRLMSHQLNFAVERDRPRASPPSGPDGRATGGAQHTDG